MRCTSRLSSFEARVHLEQRGSLCLHSLAECGLTIPSSGPAPAGFAVLHGPLKSNVSALARSMKRSLVHALASGCASFKRSRPLSLHRLHSGVGAAWHRALRHLQWSSAPALRAMASKAGKRASLAERLRTGRQRSRGPEQYTSGLAPLACVQSQWRSRCAPFLAIGRANLSFKRTRLRRSA